MVREQKLQTASANAGASGTDNRDRRSLISDGRGFQFHVRHWPAAKRDSIPYYSGFNVIKWALPNCELPYNSEDRSIRDRRHTCEFPRNSDLRYSSHYRHRRYVLPP